ncbi:MAG: 2-iminoacetate synthase ThiH [Deltaproteobacteria bacterium]|nr:2-iminoacetate synthase ThiH [Deltaproteobacteria bacterium]
MSFKDLFIQYDWDKIKAEIYMKNASHVEAALSKTGPRGLQDLMALLSPAAAPFIEQMAVLSHELTQKRFGKTLQMYIPLYLSNKCSNNCLYCGFRNKNRIKRITLTMDQIMDEVRVIKSYGFDHVLLVTGESKKDAGVEYLEDVLRLIRPFFSHISMEVQPMEQEDYERLIKLGLNTVLVYQETYGKKYHEFHPGGMKSNFYYRLDTPDRIGSAGIHKIGLGVLLGLDDWRADSWFTGLHLNYLKKRYWKTRYSVSFPRLRPATGVIEPRVIVSDRELAQMICAYRIFDENLELSISTRECVRFRDNSIKIGITSISAGSKTEPGGYTTNTCELEQFEINDSRSPDDIASMISSSGYEAVWKDWDINYGTPGQIKDSNSP